MVRASAVTALVVACAEGLGLAHPAQAEPLRLRTVVLHVDRQTDVPSGVLARAEALACELFDRIGVRIVWTDGHARSADPDGALHLDVVILTREQADRRNPDTGSLGQAARETGRAYIFYSRILSFSMRTGNVATLVLANVLAHELGHMLLQKRSHSTSGLMEPHLKQHIATMPDFTSDQRTQIRITLQADLEPPDDGEAR